MHAAYLQKNLVCILHFHSGIVPLALGALSNPRIYAAIDLSCFVPVSGLRRRGWLLSVFYQT
jgi:hypothetical protein